MKCTLTLKIDSTLPKECRLFIYYQERFLTLVYRTKIKKKKNGTQVTDV